MACGSIPKVVRVVEVGPRDGLQSESTLLETGDKVELIHRLSRAGLSCIEATSFVNPKRVPPMADSDQLFAAVSNQVNARLICLVPNMRGLERAISVGCQSIALFTAASETFSQKNIGHSIAQTFDEYEEMVPVARQNGIWIRGYVSTAFHCPFEGKIAPIDVVEVSSRLIDLGVDEISVADTIGHASPTEVAALTDLLLPRVPIDKLAYHFHDTYGAALANVFAALQYGVSNFDSSVGGIGGCPFAPGASGNLATEDLVSLLHGMEIETGIDLPSVIDVAEFIGDKLGRQITSKRYLAAIADRVNQRVCYE